MTHRPARVRRAGSPSAARRCRTSSCSTRPSTSIRRARPDEPYDVRSGRPEWERAHIPGSRFADLVDELSDPDAALPFTLPLARALRARRSAALGVGDDTLVVAYDGDSGMWAAACGGCCASSGTTTPSCSTAASRPGRAAGRPLTAEPRRRRLPSASPPRFRPELVADRDEVRDALEDPSILLVNALSPELHRGDESRYGRAGHIPGSVNVPARSLLRPDGRLQAGRRAAARRSRSRVRSRPTA